MTDTDTVTCYNCGTTLPGDAMFCTKCGTRVEAATTEAPSPPPPDATGATDDVTRVTTPGLLDTTQVLPGATPQQEPISPDAPPAARPEPSPPEAAPEPPGWAPPAAAPPPWQPPPTAAGPQGASQPPPAGPGWAPEAPAGAQPTWSSGPATPSAPPSAPPSQWQQPAPGHWPASATPASSRRIGAPVSAALAFLGAILLVIGVFTLWLKSAQGSSVKLTGWEMITIDKGEAGVLKTPDPAILLGIAAASIAVGALLVVGVSKSLMRILLLLAGIGAGVVFVRDYLSIKDAVRNTFTWSTTIDFQYGFWLAAAGAVVLLVAAVVPAGRNR